MATDLIAEWHAELTAAGGTLRASDGQEIAWSFGDEAMEHTALRGTTGVLDDTDRAVFRVRGARATEMIGGLVTQDLRGIEDGEARYAFMLTPRGRPLADLRILRLGDELWLDLPAACAAQTTEHLKKFLPPQWAHWERAETLHRLGLVGPEATRAMAHLDAGWLGPLPSELAPLRASRASIGQTFTGVFVAREPIEGPGFDLYLEEPHLVAGWRALATAAAKVGGRPCGRAAWEILRVERGLPVYGQEITLDVLPQETGQEARAISFEKGCYTGQEVVARIHFRGHVNRVLRGIRLPASRAGSGGEQEQLPDAGTALYLQERVVAELTTAVNRPGGDRLALASVRRGVEPGTSLALTPDGPPECTVEDLPFTFT